MKEVKKINHKKSLEMLKY